MGRKRIDLVLVERGLFESRAKARAVGGAAHANPVAIIVPCHRLIGANGSLTGFGGGLALKQALLDLERDHPGPEQRP